MSKFKVGDKVDWYRFRTLNQFSYFAWDVRDVVPKKWYHVQQRYRISSAYGVSIAKEGDLFLHPETTYNAKPITPYCNTGCRTSKCVKAQGKEHEQG